MDFLTWILVILLFIVVGFFAVAGVWTYYLSQPTTGVAPMQGWVNEGTTTYVAESYYDPTISTPTQQLYLGKFDYNSDSTFPPRCLSTYYAIRYVRPSDGGYSTMGPWMEYPVIAGATTLPCPPNGCSSSVWTGCNGKQNNNVYVGTPDSLTYDPFSVSGSSDPIYANIHRYSGATRPADGTDPGSQIIGVLFPSTISGFQWGWQDTVITDDTGSVCPC